MTPAELEEKIEHARVDELTIVGLQGHQPTNSPASIGNLTNSTELGCVL
jgi:hypothetical protein